MSDINQQPRCAVGGFVAPGAMCSRIIVGRKFCGSDQPCPHKVPADAASGPLPDDVMAALLKTAKLWILGNYVGGRKKLDQWNDHYAYLTQIRSYDLEGDRRKNLRRLARLAANGLLIELPRYTPGVGTRSFTAPQPILDEIGREAVREWEAKGYRVGVMVPAIVETAS